MKVLAVRIRQYLPVILSASIETVREYQVWYSRHPR
jgi:hypothetical protein